MSNRIKQFFCVGVLLAFGAAPSLAESKAPTKAFPIAPLSYVYDEPSLLSRGAEEKLSQLLSNEDRQSGNQVLVAIFKSLDNEDLVDYTSRLYKAWKIGDKQKNNGVLLTIFLAERKIRIEVGYGLEPVLTDAKSNRVISTILGPAFKQQRFDEGVVGAAQAILNTIHPGNAQASEVPDQNGQQQSLPFPVIIFLFIFFGLSFISRLLRMGSTIHRGGYRNNGFWMGGFGGGGGGFGGGGGGFSGGGGSSGGGGASGGW
jgi:uncharacterized protein